MAFTLQWVGWHYLGLLGFPVAVICYERMLAVHRRPVERTFIALDIKAHMVVLYGFAAVSAFALACYSLWRIVHPFMDPGASLSSLKAGMRCVWTWQQLYVSSMRITRVMQRQRTTQ
jgi:hypothetical protein